MLLTGCAGEPPSRLEARAAEAPARATPATPETAPAGAEAGPRAPAAPRPDGLIRAGKGPTVELRLALHEPTTYQITTVGLVQYPGMPKATGFARREEITLSACEGEGSGRICLLEHRTTKFEAEPPYGKFIEGDERPMRPVTTTHKIKASGERIGDTAIEAPPELADNPAVVALAEVERFYCIRFPEVPVGVGAAWEATCTLRTDGRLARRKVTWEVAKIDEDPDGGGKRVELREVGTFEASDGKNTRSGTFGGTLFFFADAGEPHLLREEINTEVTQQTGLRTAARLNVQFAKVSPDAPDTITRTDGKPFPDAPPEAPADATKAPADAPAGLN